MHPMRRLLHSAPGYVWVTPEEIAQIAAEIGESDIAAFEQRYVRKVGNRKSLKEFANGDCVFLDSQTRRLHGLWQSPRQCRTWPFWDSNVETPEDWQHTCEVCPGSGKGKLYSLEAIEELRRVIKI